jgi:molybdopterin molybdotransferase
MSSVVHILDGPLPPADAGADTPGVAGAIVCFDGVVRATEDGRPITALDYEVYEPMASHQLRGLCDDMQRRFELLSVSAWHSRGRVPVGACSFRLCIAAQHRTAALQAMAEFIDRLKQDVPIWKTPVFANDAAKSQGDRAASVRDAFASPDDAVAALCARLQPVSLETVPLAGATGRVLAAAFVADRDSPPCDVSAMDGYAVRLTDLSAGVLEIAGEVAVGREPPALPAGRTLRIVTGAPAPAGADAVLPREEVDEHATRIVLHFPAKPITAGLHIRRRGENLFGGEPLLAAGHLLHAGSASALASFGAAEVAVYRRIRVGILNTGSELVPVDAAATPWQIHDANGPGLRALLSACRWLEVQPPLHATDDFDVIRTRLAGLLDGCDAVLLTGGVSAGQYDFVPDVIKAVGGTTVFHRLPIRPGAPLLGAVGSRGQAIFGLPGNPVSVLVTARRFALPALRTLAGFAEPRPTPPAVAIGTPDAATLRMWWYRLVRLTVAGQAELVPTRGSGDLVSQARADGFVEVPPHTSGPGPWPYYSWNP